jgi:acyl-CoA synthetase (AMP-forming)/AMP-acid ligase II
MTDAAFREYLQTFTLERYETEFTDRHLLHGVIEKWARETPDAVAIHEFDTGRDYTYRQFDELSTEYALKLVELGFRRGDFLATLLPLLAEHLFLEYACFKIGVIHAPLDMRLKAPEVVRSLGLVEAKGFAYAGQSAAVDFAEIAPAVQRECPFVEHYIEFSPPGKTMAGAISFADFTSDAKKLAETARKNPADPIWKQYVAAHDSVQPTDGAQVIYTTGSTGFPKPALQSHRNITSQNMCLGNGFGANGFARSLCNLPPSHVGCQAEQVMTTLFGGGTAVILHVFDPEKSLKAVQDQKIVSFGQVPAMFHMQWRLPNYADYDLSSVEVVMFGGQTVTAPFVERLKEIAPLVGTGLGLTEMSGFVTYTGATDKVENLIDSVGWDMPITPLTIRKPMNADGTAGEELPDGDTGEICFSGPQVFIEYVNNPEAYRKTVSTEGICYTGDLGYKSDRGLIFCGRSKLVIKPKGYQIHPAQVEQHFADLKEYVAVCGAVGAPHDIYAECVVLFVESKPDVELSREMLEEHAKGIASYMRPSHYVLLAPGQFPLNRIAKTDYVKLGEMAKAEAERQRKSGTWDR